MRVGWRDRVSGGDQQCNEMDGVMETRLACECAEREC